RRPRAGRRHRRRHPAPAGRRPAAGRGRRRLRAPRRAGAAGCGRLRLGRGRRTRGRRARATDPGRGQRAPRLRPAGPLPRSLRPGGGAADTQRLLAVPSLAAAAAAASAAEEDELLSLLNALRSSRGLPPAVVHAELGALADEWALRMAAERDIFHSPLDRRVRADWVRLGENVAVDVSVAAAERALEASSDHLANLLDPVYDYVGIGVAHGTDGGVYVVQEFMQLASGPPRQPAQAQPLPAAPKRAIAAPVRRGPSPPRPPLLPSAGPLPPPPRRQPRLPSARLTDIFGPIRP